MSATPLKCKMCGGNIVLSGETHGVCDSCGYEVTLPKVEDDSSIQMYNRADQSRRKGNFDRAYSAYEHLVAEDPEEAEAHWCLMLCRYGVEYVQNTVTGDYVPTISRVNPAPVLEDIDYLAALKYSDEETAAIYRREAERIEQICRQYMEIARNETPYDVFICYKATDDQTKQRTLDSVIAQDIYEALTERGLKVFFSRISLADKVGEAYEPYIFAALNSAKVMLLVATRKEHLEARWVRNEWSRYLAFMRKDPTYHIIPVFAGMSPGDFPAEIPGYQGADMGRPDAMRDLTENVMGIIGRHTDVVMPVHTEDRQDQSTKNQLKAVELQRKVGASPASYVAEQIHMRWPDLYVPYQNMCLKYGRDAKNPVTKAAALAVSFVGMLLGLLAALALIYYFNRPEDRPDGSVGVFLIFLIVVSLVCSVISIRAIRGKGCGIIRIVLGLGVYFLCLMLSGGLFLKFYEAYVGDRREVPFGPFLASLYLALISLMIVPCLWKLLKAGRFEIQKKKREKFYERHIRFAEEQIRAELNAEWKQATGVDDWLAEELLSGWNGR